MKKLISVSILICSIPTFCSAQTSIEFIPTGGYTFNYTTEFFSKTGRLDGGFNYGASLIFNLSKKFGIDLMYSRMQTPAKLFETNAVPGDQPLYQTSAGINYLMAGFLFSIPVNKSPVNFFFGPEIGAMIGTPPPNSFESNVHFAMGFQAGANIYFNPRYGIRLSGRLIGTAKNKNEVYFGDWGGGDGFLSQISPGILQGGFNIGFIVGLGNVLPEPRKQAKTPKKHRHPVVRE